MFIWQVWLPIYLLWSENQQTKNPGKIIKNVGSSKDSDSTGPKVLGTCILKNCIYIYSFIFGCAKALLLCRLFCSCGKCWLLSICGAQASRCSGFSCCGAWAPGTRDSVVVDTGLVAKWHVGILLEQGSNPCRLHWQAESQPLDH